MAEIPVFQGTQTELLAHYNRWMNEKLYASARLLSDEERKRDLKAFFRSVHSTLNHLLYVDTAMLGRLTERPAASLPPFGSDLFDDFEELNRARIAKDEELLEFARGVTEEWLKTPRTWTSALMKQTFTHPNFALVSQLFNHQTHHRGQVTALLTQLGVDPGVTDIPMLPALNGW